MHPFIQALKKYGDFSEEIEQILLKKVQEQHKKKGDFLLKKGQVHANISLLHKGLVRAFYIKENKEINTWFAKEDDFIGSITPLFAQKPSFESLQFLEDSVLYTIAAKDMEELYKNYPAFNLIGRKIAEELCLLLEERTNALHSLNAQERYKMLCEQQAYILKRVNLGHIASFLGITQETLSRIRSKF